MILPRRRPRLSSEIVSDAQQLWTAIDEVIRTMPGSGKRRRQILDLQEKLNEVVENEGWAIYLELDETSHARVELILIEITQWAYAEGRLQGVRRRRG